MSTLEEYINKREELIASERALRFDAQAIANATEEEKRAVDIVHAIRTKEALEIWNANAEKLMYPGMEFLIAKETILSTKLYEVVKKLPKGGLLHGHMDAMCDAKFLYQAALEYPQMHIRVDSAITSDTSLPLPQFKPLTTDLCARHSNAPSLTTSEYVPRSWVPLQKARNEFAYGPEAFDKWIVGSMMINPKEAYVDYNTSVKIWEKFVTTFRVAGGMIRYEPIMKRYMRQVMLSSIEDGISYVELRVNFFYKQGVREDGSETLEHRDYLVLLGQTIQEVKDQMKAENREDEFVGAKVIYTTLRFIDNEELMWYLEDCMALKQEFPDLIAGFDLVAQEDTGKPLIYYIESLLWFQQETKKRGLEIPFILHAGETLDDGGAADSNLYDALLLGTKRIGHGFSLAKHPVLMQMCKERGVAIEVCPISNEILRLTSSMPMHPLPVLLNNGVSVALCPDDPSVFGNMGLSFDFFQVIVASEVTNLLSLKQLARQSLEYSSLNADDKKRAIELWETRWRAYIEGLGPGPTITRGGHRPCSDHYIPIPLQPLTVYEPTDMRGVDSDITEHAQRRASLIATERSLRFDAGVIASATEKEKRAVEIVNKIRMREAQEIWNARERKLIYPNMDFFTARRIIMNTELYQITRKLPKGGLLRGHVNTMCGVEFIYNIALEYPAIHVRVNSRITSDAPLPVPQFKPLPSDLIADYADGPSLTSADYVLGSWVSLTKARREFVHGGPKAFDEWILRAITLDDNGGSNDFETLDKVRVKLLSAYRVSRGILCYEPVLKRYLRRMLLSLVEDGVSYAEFRTNFSYKVDIWEDGSETLSHSDYLDLFGEAVQEVKDQLRLESREDEFVGAKLIYTVFRTMDKNKLRWYLEDCMTLKTKFPDLIAGFDFLGPEYQGKPLSDYLEPLMWFQQETKRRNLDIPFIFLVGEPMGDEQKADNNLYDALLLGAKRIGHGTNLTKHPLLMQMAKDRGVAVEVCPISNEILGLTTPIHHPLTTLLNHGVPVVLCPDNPAWFGDAGLSFDFFQAIVGSTDSSLLSLKQLAKQSLEYSTLNAHDKKIALGMWEKRWAAFVDEILDRNPGPEH